MQIASLLNGLSDATIAGKRPESTRSSGANYAAPSAAGPPANDNARASPLGQILSQYNVRQITPAEFSNMIQQLRESGEIGDAELQELAQVRRDLDQAGTDPNKPVDLLRFYAKRAEQLESQKQALGASGDPAAGGNPAAEEGRKQIQNELAAVARRRQWIEKLAAMHESSDAVGLDVAG